MSDKTNTFVGSEEKDDEDVSVFGRSDIDFELPIDVELPVIATALAVAPEKKVMLAQSSGKTKKAKQLSFHTEDVKGSFSYD